MSEFIELAVVPRDRIAKASRKLAHMGKVPAVLYGVGHESEALAIDRHELERLLSHDGVRSLVLHVKIEGRKTPVNAMVKAIQTELGEGDPEQAELEELRGRIDALKLPEEAEKAARRELSRLERLPAAAATWRRSRRASACSTC